MQNDFSACRDNLRNVKQSVAKLVKYFNRRNWPIIVVEFKGNGDTCPEVKFLIQNFEKRLVIKESVGGGKELLEYISANNLEHITDFIFCGVNTCQCVMETAKGFREKTNKRCYVSFRACSCVCDQKYDGTKNKYVQHPANLYQEHCRTSYETGNVRISRKQGTQSQTPTGLVVA
jgi:nicotinamidase-related amidase